MSGMNLEMLLASQSRRFTRHPFNERQRGYIHLMITAESYWKDSMNTLWAIFVYTSLHLCPHFHSHSHTHTHKLANINILRSHSPDPWGLPCVVLFVKFTVMLSLLIILCRACRPGTVGDDSSAAFSLCWTAQTCCSSATNTGEMFGAWSSMDICFSCEECIKIETYLQNQQ